tara:strand:- start:399 stop:2099 length:1701 start_codon:yes stop_codon:yes gene_type:complete
MPFDPNQPFETVTSPSGFDPSKPFETVEAPAAKEPGFFEEASDTIKGLELGAERGFTYGFSEKLRALGTSISPLQLLPGFESLTYDEALAAERSRAREIEEKAPIATIVGDVGGSILSGGGAVKGLAATAKVGAGLGALEAAGRTEDLLSTEGLIDVAQGAGIGAAVPIALHGAGAGIKKVGSAINKVVRKGVDLAPEISRVVTGIDTRVTKGIMRDPIAFENAKTLDKIADELQEGMEALQTQVRHYDDAATRHLSDKVEVDFEGFDGDLLNLLHKERVINKGAKTGEFAVSNLADAKNSYSTVEGVLAELDEIAPTETNIKRIIKQLDAMANWKSDTPDTTKKVLRQVRRLIDQRLKKGNPEYTKSMKQTAEKASLLEEMTDAFKLKNGEIGDTAFTKLKTLRDAAIKGNKPGTKALVDRFNPNMMKDLEFSRLREVAEQGTAQGSRRVLTGENIGSTIGGAIGGTIGGWPGMVIGAGVGKGVGAAAGFVVDSKGQKWTSQIVKSIAKDKKKWDIFLNEVGFTGSEKAASVFRRAAATGGLRRMILIGKHMDQKEKKDSKKSPK